MGKSFSDVLRELRLCSGAFGVTRSPTGWEHPRNARLYCSMYSLTCIRYTFL